MTRGLAEKPTHGALLGDKSPAEGGFLAWMGRPGLLEALQAFSGSTAGRRSSTSSRRPLFGSASKGG